MSGLAVSSFGKQRSRQGFSWPLILEISHLGQLRGIKTMAAMMRSDQTDMRAACETLGFQVEALLPDWAIDLTGRRCHLLFMSYDLERLSNQA